MRRCIHRERIAPPALLPAASPESLPRTNLGSIPATNPGHLPATSPRHIPATNLVLFLTTGLLFLLLPGVALSAAECSAKGRFAARTAQPASAGDQRIDVTFYRLDLRVEPRTSTISGSVELVATSLVDGLTSVTLDLSTPMTIDSVRQPGFLLPVTRYPSSFAVQLPRAYAKGEVLAFQTFYHGTPGATGFGSFLFSAITEGAWVWSLSEPYGARDWWPCKDHPLDKADSVDIRVTCPNGLKVGSNGRLLSVRDNADGTSTHTWAERYPIATYLVSVAIAPYVTFSNWYRYGASDSMEILNYVLPQHAAEAREKLPRTVDILAVFSRLFGPYPFLNEKYGHCEFGAGGAMEHQTMTSTTTFDEDVIAHELAHQWFGDMITCRTWQDLWLNEGFATYSESLYREARYGADQYRAWIRYRLSDARAAQGPLFVLDTTSVSALFARPRVYSKGASVLHMLRHVMGDTLFFRALRAYAGDPGLRFGTARTADFQRICEDVSGKPLSYFFDQWIYGENYPRYSLQWEARSEGSRWAVHARLDQETGTSNPLVFVMPVDIRFAAAGRETTVVVWNSQKSEPFTFAIPFKPERVDVDPDQWILREIIEPDPQLAATPVLEPNYPNPFNGGTTITVQNPRRNTLLLTIHNILGQQIATLNDDVVEPGTHTYYWNPGAPVPGPGARRDREVASGVYYCRLLSGGAVLTRNMLFIR